MVDVPPASAIAAAAATTVAPVATSAPIETSVASLPDKIQQIVRQIQVNATVAALPGDGTITLNSIVGPLTLQLPQLANAEQQNLTQQLLGLLQNQRPLTVVVQPGTPPTQAFLFLPPPSGGTATAAQTPVSATVPNIAPNQAVSQPLPVSVTAGTTLSAIVLPTNQTGQANISAQQATPLYIPVSSTPELTPVLTPATAALSSLTGNPAPALTNIPAFQELAAGTEITAGANLPQPQSAAPTNAPLAPSQNLLPANTATSPPLTPQGVQQPDSLASNVQSNLQLNLPQQNQTPSSAAQAQPPTPLPTQTQAPATTAPAPAAAATSQINSAVATPVTPAVNPVAFAQTTPPATALLQTAGNEVTLQVNAVIPPSTPLAALPTPGPNQVLATVTSSGLNGQVLLQAGDTALYVKQSVDLPVGTKLLLTIEQAKEPALQTLAAPQAQNFTNLQAALNTLTQINPQLAQQVLANNIPQATAALPGALLFFMSALKQGNVRTWLGDDAVDALNRAGKFELLSKLSQDLTSAGETARDATVGEWKSYPIPLQNNGQFQVLNFYVHGDGGGNGNSFSTGETSKKLHTRFVIDVRMSQLGPMQLDGFVQQRKLDLMVRSEHVLPEGLHTELRQVYTNAISAIGYAGSLNFQVGRHHWLIIQNAKGQAVVVT